MSDSNFTFNRPYKPFGFNVQVPERTLQQAGETLENIVKAPATPLFSFLEENESVFNGDVAFEINKTVAQNLLLVPLCVKKMKKLMVRIQALICTFNLFKLLKGTN